MLDVLSGGRFDFGVGVGGEYPPEFEAVNVPHKERGARTDEALKVLKELWTGEPVEFEGRFFKMPGIKIDPPPVQKPGPTMWVAGRSEAAMRRTARYGDYWMPYMYTPEQLKASIETIREEAEKVDRDPAQIRSIINCFICVDEDGDRARQIAVESVSGVYKIDFSGHRSKYLIAGTAEECAEGLAEYFEAGATGAVFSLACGKDRSMDTIAATGEHVLPAIRKAYGSAA
jgi:alkanesulfonate monooxygenase SsuD/methylene tetrahydromethanopterin reductase-like flavin-dependent oxidoreductase (luciferase family)